MDVSLVAGTAEGLLAGQWAAWWVALLVACLVLAKVNGWDGVWGFRSIYNRIVVNSAEHSDALKAFHSVPMMEAIVVHQLSPFLHIYL
jgi:hypothetical protein